MAPDPRYVDFDKSRVEQLFYDGYCACSGEGGGCQANIDCCGISCVFDDVANAGACRECVEQTDYKTQSGGQQCASNLDCCQNDPEGRVVTCYPLGAGGQTYCQPCRGQDEPVVDANANNMPDYNNCCGDLELFRGPEDGIPATADPVCSDCRSAGMTCNNRFDCCPPTGLDTVAVPSTLRGGPNPVCIYTGPIE